MSRCPVRKKRWESCDRPSPTPEAANVTWFGRPVLEAVGEQRRVAVKHLVGRRVLPLVPDLHAVGAGHVGERAPVGVQRDVLHTKAVHAAVIEVGVVAVDRRLLEHRGLVEDAVRRGRARCRHWSCTQTAKSRLRAGSGWSSGFDHVACVTEYGRSKYPRSASGENVVRAQCDPVGLRVDGSPPRRS